MIFGMRRVQVVFLVFGRGSMQSTHYFCKGKLRTPKTLFLGAVIVS